MLYALLTMAVVLLLLILLTQLAQIALAGYRDQRLAKNIVRLAGVSPVPDALAWVVMQVNAAAPEAWLQAVDSPRVQADLRSLELLADDGRRVIVSPFSASELHRLEQQRLARLPKLARGNAPAPLLAGGTSRVTSLRCSVLNAGACFDLEVAQVGQLLNVPGWGNVRQLWFHICGG